MDFILAVSLFNVTNDINSIYNYCNKRFVMKQDYKIIKFSMEENKDVTGFMSYKKDITIEFTHVTDEGKYQKLKITSNDYNMEDLGITDPDECTCSLQTLMIGGCSCGSLKKPEDTLKLPD